MNRCANQFQKSQKLKPLENTKTNHVNATKKAQTDAFCSAVPSNASCLLASTHVGTTRARGARRQQIQWHMARTTEDLTCNVHNRVATKRRTLSPKITDLHKIACLTHCVQQTTYSRALGIRIHSYMYKPRIWLILNSEKVQNKWRSARDSLARAYPRVLHFSIALVNAKQQVTSPLRIGWFVGNADLMGLQGNSLGSQHTLVTRVESLVGIDLGDISAVHFRGRLLRQVFFFSVHCKQVEDQGHEYATIAYVYVSYVTACGDMCTSVCKIAGTENDYSTQPSAPNSLRRSEFLGMSIQGLQRVGNREKKIMHCLSSFGYSFRSRSYFLTLAFSIK